MTSNAHEALERGLQPARTVLGRERRQHRSIAAMVRTARRLPAIAAAGVLVLLLVRLLWPLASASDASGAPSIDWMMLAWPAVVALLPVVALLLALPRGAAVSTYEAAVAHDRQHQAKDRLSAALELSAAPASAAHVVAGAEPRRAQLALAAVEDGVAHLQAIDAADVHDIDAGARPAGARWLLGTAVAAVAILLPSLASTATGPDDATMHTARAGDAAGGARGGDDRTAEPHRDERPTSAAARNRAERRDAQVKEQSPSNPTREAAAATAAAAGQSGSTTGAQPAQASAGKPKAAHAGAAAAGNEGSGGQGQASDSAAEAKPEEQTAGKPRKPKPKRPAREEQNQQAAPSESAATPSGPSRGGGKMAPVGNTAKGIDRGVERDEELDTEDEDIEDQKEESEQRGGVMPLSRDRSTPAGRELTISGDGPPNDGRGGPTPPKKSRGTASLVLGITLPDQVRGQPNPGTAKTSIEQTPPHPEPAQHGASAAAAPSPPGHPQQRSLASSIESIVLRYHELMKQSR